MLMAMVADAASRDRIQQKSTRTTVLALLPANRDVLPVNVLAGKRWLSWTRLGCVAGTLALLWLVFRKIDFAGFTVALARTRPAACGLAFVTYGVALTFQAYRWHLGLRAVRCAV